MKLTENFSLAEMTKSETALRLDMDNTPEPEHLENLKSLAENILQPIREAYGRGV
jgi:zinc D-Ala-D-Ala carboxypeptidase